MTEVLSLSYCLNLMNPVTTKVNFPLWLFIYSAVESLRQELDEAILQKNASDAGLSSSAKELTEQALTVSRLQAEIVELKR